MAAINCVGNLKAKPGGDAALRDLLAEFVDTVRSKDPGTLAFGFFESGTAGEYTAVEIYRSSEDALVHLENVGPLLGRLAELLDPEAHQPLQVYGDPSPALRERYDAFDGVYHAALGAF